MLEKKERSGYRKTLSEPAVSSGGNADPTVAVNNDNIQIIHAFIILPFKDF